MTTVDFVLFISKFYSVSIFMYNKNQFINLKNMVKNTSK